MNDTYIVMHPVWCTDNTATGYSVLKRRVDRQAECIAEAQTREGALAVLPAGAVLQGEAFGLEFWEAPR